MKKVVKWIIFVVILLIMAGIIMFCCGFLKIRLKTPYGGDVDIDISDVQQQGYVHYLTHQGNCKFNGFSIDFKRESDEGKLYKDYMRLERNTFDDFDFNED